MSLRMPFLDSRGMSHSWDRYKKAATAHGDQLRLTPDSSDRPFALGTWVAPS